MSNNQLRKLTEGLRSKDLKDFVNPVFTVDRYKSKMGEDSDIVVLGFRVTEKYPAMDLMEFVEKGYNFILDADISAGEENDGQYQVFVELERTTKLPGQMRELLSGISQLCDCYDWKFRYQRSNGAIPFSEEKVMEHIPTSAGAYKSKILEIKNQEVGKFFNQGAIDGGARRGAAAAVPQRVAAADRRGAAREADKVKAQVLSAGRRAVQCVSFFFF